MARPKEVHYHKLVRDGIPKKIRDNGEIPEFHFLTSRKKVQSLFEKLVEEATEAAYSKRATKRLLEIADILEVIDEILRMHCVGLRDIRKIQSLKRRKFGGFKLGTFLKTTRKAA